jgi:hypothetical protein
LPDDGAAGAPAGRVTVDGVGSGDWLGLLCFFTVIIYPSNEGCQYITANILAACLQFFDYGSRIENAVREQLVVIVVSSSDVQHAIERGFSATPPLK